MYKPSTINAKLALALGLAVLLVACKSTPVAPAKVEDKSTGSSQSGANDGADTSGVKEVVIDSNATGGDSALRDPNNILSKRSIYFDFDSDAVKAEYRPMLEAHAKYLLAHTDAKVVLQGNTDQRGTREYNL